MYKIKQFRMQYTKGEELNLEEIRLNKLTWVKPKYINNEIN